MPDEWFIERWYEYRDCEVRKTKHACKDESDARGKIASLLEYPGTRKLVVCKRDSSKHITKVSVHQP